jgi:hypothetical protein
MTPGRSPVNPSVHEITRGSDFATLPCELDEGYQLTTRLGEGGFGIHCVSIFMTGLCCGVVRDCFLGIVWRIRHIGSGKEFAVKFEVVFFFLCCIFSHSFFSSHAGLIALLSFPFGGYSSLFAVHIRCCKLSIISISSMLGKAYLGFCFLFLSRQR